MELQQPPQRWYPQTQPAPGVHISLAFKGLLRRRFEILPRSPMQCLTVSVTRKILLPAKLPFQYHLLASELPFYICALGWFFSFLLPLLLRELHCTDKPGDQLKAASVSSDPFISSPRIAIHTRRHRVCQWGKQGPALAQASPWKALSLAALSAWSHFLDLLKKMLHVTLSKTLLNSQHTTFTISFSLVGWFLTPCYMQVKLIHLSLWQWSTFKLLSVKSFLPC